MKFPFKEPARRAMRNLCCFRLWMQSHPLQTSTLGRVLVLAPHADDEALGCGHLLAELVKQGGDIRITYFTDGSGGLGNHPRIDRETVAQWREKEAMDAMALLGIDRSKLHFMKAPDGRLAHLDPTEEANWQSKLRQHLVEVQPDVVFLPFRKDGSSEHEALFILFSKILRSLDPRPRVMEFPVWSWWNPRFLWPNLDGVGMVWHYKSKVGTDIKNKLLQCYGSQVRPVPPVEQAALSPDFLHAFSQPHEFFFEKDQNP